MYYYESSNTLFFMRELMFDVKKQQQFKIIKFGLHSYKDIVKKRVSIIVSKNTGALLKFVNTVAIRTCATRLQFAYWIFSFVEQV